MPQDHQHDGQLERLQREVSGAWDAKEYAKQQHAAAWGQSQALQEELGPEISDLRARHAALYETTQGLKATAAEALAKGFLELAAAHSAQAKQNRGLLRHLVDQRRKLVDRCLKARTKSNEAYDLFTAKREEFVAAQQRVEDYKLMKLAARLDADFDAGIERHGDKLKVVRSHDHKTHIYFGGLGGPDGPGHAHYVLDADGNVEYRRDPFTQRGPHNYVEPR